MSKATEREEFLVRLQAECPGNGVHNNLIAGRLILRYARILQRLAEAECNRELTDRERTQDRLTELRLVACVTSLGMSVNVNGDPRGYVVKVAFPSGAFNTMGGMEAGYGVPA